MALELAFYPGQSFLFLPRTGALTPDSGRIARIPESEGRKVTRDGQDVTIFNPTWTLKGKTGTLTIGERDEWSSSATTGTGTASRTPSPSGPGRS